MEDFCMEEYVIPIFKLSGQAHMYEVCLAQLGADIEGCIHTTRLKIRTLSVFPDLGAHLQWNDVLLSFLDDIGDVLRMECNLDSDAMHLA